VGLFSNKGRIVVMNSHKVGRMAFDSRQIMDLVTPVKNIKSDNIHAVLNDKLFRRCMKASVETYDDICRRVLLIDAR
jgi:isocitrate/isopropylmalate dehydrogenase